MRTLILSLCFFTNLQAQEWCIFNFTPVNFDDGTCIGNFYIDTLENPENIWQIGVPNKTVFTSGNWQTKAMVTDTLYPYPVNNTSYFVIKTLYAECASCQPLYTNLETNYWVDSDSLNDYGTIEFSPDNGLSWIDLVNDPIFTDYVIWYSNLPILTGNSGGFQYMHFGISSLLEQFDINFMDTISFRFSFFSDNIPEEKDGLMFDDFYFLNEFIGATNEHTENRCQSYFYPNPSGVNTTLKLKGTYRLPLTLYITDHTGSQMMRLPVTTSDTPFDTFELPAGVYYCFLKNEWNENIDISKFIKI